MNPKTVMVLHLIYIADFFLAHPASSDPFFQKCAFPLQGKQCRKWKSSSMWIL